jgi:DNA-3-methyladenine glycosylase II
VSAAAVSRGTERWTLQAIPPFRLDLTVWALRRRARNAVDRWDGTTYRRTICVDGRPIELAIAQPGSATAARVTVGATPAVRVRTRVDAVIRRLLGLNVDLTAWYRLAAADARLRPLADRFRGVKPPRFPSVFEAVVNAFACQQLSLEVGLELLNRLAARAAGAPHGGAALSAPSRGLPFPRPHDVARLRRSSIRALGFSTQKAHAILTLARALDRGTLDLESLGALDDEDACARLLDLRGVGRWTAEYVLLRGLGRLNVFPGDDVGAQKRLARWLGRRAPLDYAGVRRATRAWEPYAGLVYFHLLLDGLAHAGVVRAA